MLAPFQVRATLTVEAHLWQDPPPKPALGSRPSEMGESNSTQTSYQHGCWAPTAVLSSQASGMKLLQPAHRSTLARQSRFLQVYF